MVQHHTVETTEQQGALGIPLQGEADVVELAARQEDADGIKALQTAIAQQPGQALTVQGGPLGETLQQRPGGSIPRNHVDGPVHVQHGRRAAEGLAGQQLAVTVGNQQQFER